MCPQLPPQGPIGYPPSNNQGPVYTSQPTGQYYQQQQPGIPMQPGVNPNDYDQDPNKSRRRSSSGGGCLEMCCCRSFCVVEGLISGSL